MIFDERPTTDTSAPMEPANSQPIVEAVAPTPSATHCASAGDAQVADAGCEQVPVAMSAEDAAKKLASEKGERLRTSAEKIRKKRSAITKMLLEIGDLLEETRNDLRRDDGRKAEDPRKLHARLRAFAHVEAGIPRDEINTYLRLGAVEANDRAVLTQQGSGFAVLKAILSDTALRQDVVDRMRASIPMDAAAVRRIRRQRKLAAETPLFALIRKEPDRNKLASRKELAVALKAFEADTAAFTYRLADLASNAEVSDEDYRACCQVLSPVALELLQRVASLIQTEDMAQEWTMLWSGSHHTDPIAEALLALQSIAFGEYFIRNEEDGSYLETDDDNIDRRLVVAVARLAGIALDDLAHLKGLKPARRKRIPAPPVVTKLIAPPGGLRSIEICAGAGGQALGLHAAGFHARAIFEWEKDAAETLRQHFQYEVNRVFSEDIRRVDFSLYRGGIDLLAGGVPCQSFSTAGLRKGEKDERDLFRRAVEIVDEIQPRAFFFENVKGFGQSTNMAYRAELHAAFEAIGYQSRIFQIFGTDYGLAQERPRVAFVGFRDPDAMARFRSPPAFPEWETSLADTIGDLVSANGWRGYETWRKIANRRGPTVVGGSRKSEKLSFSSGFTREDWELLGIDSTVLAETAPKPDHEGLFQLTLEMGARLQGFPDGWRFQGKPKQIKSQIGNAFPPIMAKAVGLAIHAALENVEFDYERLMRTPFVTPAARAPRSFSSAKRDGKISLNQSDWGNRYPEHAFFGEIIHDEHTGEEIFIGPEEFKLKPAPTFEETTG
jgi:DNA (cytosine-5)-methyltransferase 1